MRILGFLVCLLATASVSATEIDDVEGLRDAINTHNSALLSGDGSEVAKTVLFPHVQFYPDGRVVVTDDETDLPSLGDEQPQWRISGTKLVSREVGTAIVRVSFERLDGTDVGAGLWCFNLESEGWRIYWRHYLGMDANQ